MCGKESYHSGFLRGYTFSSVRVSHLAYLNNSCALHCDPGLAPQLSRARVKDFLRVERSCAHQCSCRSLHRETVLRSQEVWGDMRNQQGPGAGLSSSHFANLHFNGSVGKAAWGRLGLASLNKSMRRVNSCRRLELKPTFPCLS